MNTVINNINKYVVEPIELTNPGFSEKVWTAINETIVLKEAKVYSYMPDACDDDGPFSEGSLWSFNYFFYNVSLKKILYFTCYANSKFQSQHGGGEDIDETSAIDDSKSRCDTPVHFAFAGEDMEEEGYQDWGG